MQVVLTQDVPKLGRKNSVVDVKKGYFANFLAPRGKALRVTPKLKKQLDETREQMEQRRAEMMEKADELLKKIESLTVTFKRKTTPKDKLYAAVTEEQVQHEIEGHLKFHLDHGSVRLGQAIKEVGEFEALLHLAEGKEATFKVVVESE